MGPVVEVEHEGGIERAQVAEVGRIETARGVLEAHLAHGARCIRPPGVDCSIGKREVGGQIAEQVEAHRVRRQQVGPQSLVVDARSRSMSDIRALAASNAGELRKLLPVSRPYSSGMRLPTGRTASRGLGTNGCDPIGCPLASRHCAWWYRSLRRKSVSSGRFGTWSSASQQYAASSCSWESAAPTSPAYVGHAKSWQANPG